MSARTIGFICLILMVTSTAGERWGEWSPWSECSRTCDGGATYQERTCIKEDESNSTCEGERFRYNTCNNDPCPSDSVDFRAQQCAAFNNATYGGKLYTWLPYTDRKNPCALYCIPKGTRTVVRQAPKVLDGTRCKQNAYDMCITGKCWTVGCDHQLDSPLTQDMCGVCGGNNSCLNNGTKGRYQWVEIGLTPCSASCGVGTQVYQYRCKDRPTGNQVPEARCAKSPRPNEREKSCYRRQCPPVWKIFLWQPCSVSCGGGLATRAVRCMDTLKDGRQQWLHDSFCPFPKPSTSRPCNTHICPKWYAGEWSPCSATCGWGEQVREVVCRHEGEMFCDITTQPVTRRNCTTIFPCNDPDDPRHIAEHDYNGRQELVYNSPFKNEIIIKDYETKLQDLQSPKYVVTEWSPCSATCGTTYRSRYVRCQVQLQYIKAVEDLPDTECTGEKPAVTEACDLKPCYKDYKWVSRGLGPCSKTCSRGIQESQLDCVYKINNSVVPDHFCAYAEKLRTERHFCNDVACPQRWKIGDFSECSSTCGGGTMIRNVTCIQEVNVDMNQILTLRDNMCSQPIPPRVRECNTQLCPANWATGYWSECSVTCGSGVQLRPVVCQRVSQDGGPVDVDEYHCPPTEKPESETVCNASACPEIKIKEKHIKFFQINKIDKIRVYVGGEAAVLPSTTIVIMCPVKGASKHRVEWLKNDRHIKNGPRLHFSNKGNLKIIKSRPDKDTGKYTCLVENKRASVQIVFSNIYDILQESMEREKHLLEFMSNASKMNTSTKYLDPFDRKLRPLQLVVSNWTACSATCGRGVRQRNVTCEIITDNYFEIFSLKVCQNAGLEVPDTTEKCNLKPCTKWIAKDWSPCLENGCFKEGYSKKVRTVLCTKEKNTIPVHEKFCDNSTRPVLEKECRKPSCHPAWNTSSWSECMSECGQTGFQTRMLICVWEGTTLSAGRNCEGLVRPVVTRPCFNNCTNECVDNSTYCSIVPMMKLCRFSAFIKECCHSCNIITEDPPS